MQQASQSDQGAGTSKLEPFRSLGCLQTTSVGSSAASDSQHGRLATEGSQCLCNCGSLSEWSSLQLQEQHLLEPSSRNAQDMVVVVLTKSDNAAATETDSTALEKQKARLSSGGRSLQSAGARSLKVGPLSLVH